MAEARRRVRKTKNHSSAKTDGPAILQAQSAVLFPSRGRQFAALNQSRYDKGNCCVEFVPATRSFVCLKQCGNICGFINRKRRRKNFLHTVLHAVGNMMTKNSSQPDMNHVMNPTRSRSSCFRKDLWKAIIRHCHRLAGHRGRATGCQPRSSWAR